MDTKLIDAIHWTALDRADSWLEEVDEVFNGTALLATQEQIESAAEAAWEEELMRRKHDFFVYIFKAQVRERLRERRENN